MKNIICWVKKLVCNWWLWTPKIEPIYNATCHVIWSPLVEYMKDGFMCCGSLGDGRITLNRFSPL